MRRMTSEASSAISRLGGLLVAAFATASVSIASATEMEVGAYVCRIEDAELTRPNGDTIAITSVPREFIFIALAARGDPDRLRRDVPLRRLEHYEEATFARRARVDVRLFAGPTTELSSHDGVIYAQEEVVFEFRSNGRFTAGGRAAFPSEGEGLARYAGYCERQSSASAR